MRSILSGLFVVCSFVRLSLGAPGHKHAHAGVSADDVYDITMHVNSGEPDPHWSIPRVGEKDPDRVAKIIRLLNHMGHKDSNKLKTGGVLPDKLGYKGFTVEHLDKKGNSLHKWTLPLCSWPTLEWNLAIKTSPDTVSFEVKREVHQAVKACPTKTAEPSTKTADKAKTKTTDTKAPGKTTA